MKTGLYLVGLLALIAGFETGCSTASRMGSSAEGTKNRKLANSQDGISSTKNADGEFQYKFGTATQDGICDLLHSKTFRTGLKIERDNANAESRYVGFDRCRQACQEFVKKHPASCSADSETLVRSDVSCIYRLVNDVPPDTIPPIQVIQQESKNCAVWQEPASKGVEVFLNELISSGERRMVRGAPSAADGVRECRRVWNRRLRCEKFYQKSPENFGSESADSEKYIHRLLTCYGFVTQSDGSRQFHDYLSESGLCDSGQNCGHGIYSDGAQFYEIQFRLGKCD